MQFDPAIAAQSAFTRAQSRGELKEDLAEAQEAEAAFSASAGEEATAAFHTLQALGLRHPEATAFQEFLIYITWQQVTEQTIPRYFRTGLELCDRYLGRKAAPTTDEQQVRQITELRKSFRAGLGMDQEEPHDYEKDTIKGGD